MNRLILECDAQSADSLVGKAELAHQHIAKAIALLQYIQGGAQSGALIRAARDAEEALKAFEHDEIQPLVHIAEDEANSAHLAVEASCASEDVAYAFARAMAGAAE